MILWIPWMLVEGILYSQFLYGKKKVCPNLDIFKSFLKLQFPTFIEDNEIQRRKKQESGTMYLSQ